MEILLPHKPRLETDTGRIAPENHEKSSFLIPFCSPSLKSQDDSCSSSHHIFIPGRNKKDKWQNHFPVALLHLNGHICLQMWLEIQFFGQAHFQGSLLLSMKGKKVTSYLCNRHLISHFHSWASNDCFSQQIQFSVTYSQGQAEFQIYLAGL